MSGLVDEQQIYIFSNHLILAGVSITESTDELNLCECGCGQITKVGKKSGVNNRFINGHHFRGKKHTKATLLKISLAKKGTFVTQETRDKISKIHKGKITTQDTKDKISKATKGRIVSNETKLKMSIAAKNPSELTRIRMSNAHNGKKLSKEHKLKISTSLIGNKNTLGYKPSKETRDKISKANKGKKRSEETKKKRSGENCYMWKGGVSFEPYCQKFNTKLKEHVRDEYGRKCLICDKTEDENGRKLDVHHVSYDKMDGCNGNEFKLVPLCASCHSKTNHNRKYWESYILNIINT